MDALPADTKTESNDSARAEKKGKTVQWSRHGEPADLGAVLPHVSQSLAPRILSKFEKPLCKRNLNRTEAVD